MMNVQGLLDKIEDTIDMGSKIPLSGKIAVDAETIKQCIEDIRYDLPIEIEKAQEVMSHHNNIITRANNEASSIVSSAQTEADGIISAAKEKASGIAATAEANAKTCSRIFRPCPCSGNGRGGEYCKKCKKSG